MLTKKAGETRNVAVDFSAKLAVGEVLTGTPTVAEVTTADLTIAGIALNAAQRIVGSRVALAERAVGFSVAGGTSGRLYVLRITAVTGADTAQTLIEEITLRVN